MGQLYTTRSAMLVGFADLARTLGLDPEQLARSAGVPPEALASPNLRISATAAGTLLAEAAGLAGAPDLGLRLAAGRRLSNWGVLALVAREQATLGDIFLALRRYSRLQNDSVWLHVERKSDTVEAQLNLFDQNSPHARRIAMDLYMGTVHRNLRELVPAWRPNCICFRSARPRSVAPYERLFGGEVLFEQEFDGFVCSRADFDRVLPDRDGTLKEQVEQYADSLIGTGHGPLADNVVEIAIRLLPEGRCSRDAIADVLGVGLRTLQRRLAEEGASIPEALNRARDILVQSYVDGSQRSLAEVAGLLGFGSQAAFNHWHRTRYGVSPSERRRAISARAASRRTEGASAAE